MSVMFQEHGDQGDWSQEGRTGKMSHKGMRSDLN